MVLYIFELFALVLTRNTIMNDIQECVVLIVKKVRSALGNIMKVLAG